MKKIVSLFCFLLCISFLSLTSFEADAASKKVKLKLDKKTFILNKDDSITISGKTDKKATVNINNKKIKVDSNGSFKYTYEVSFSDVFYEKIQVSANKKGYKENKQNIKIEVSELSKSNSTTSELQPDDNLEKRKLNTKADGEYLVGQDIPEGEYLIIIGDRELTNRKNIFSGSYDIFSDSNKAQRIDNSSIYMEKEHLTKDGWLSKAKFSEDEISEYSSHLVLLKNGQILSLNNTKAYPADQRIQNNSKKLIEGTYKVGRDIPEGTYTVEESKSTSGETLHSLWILNSLDPEVEDNIIKIYQDYSNETYPDEIILTEGQYVTFSDLIISKK